MMERVRPIDANKLVIWLEGNRSDVDSTDCDAREVYYECIATVEAMETLDVEPMRHGQWMWEGRFKACSLCGSYIDWDDTLGANHWKFCPCCGAKMDAREGD